MSMLAEPRRKQKIINLRAKNNAWSNDSTKFGQRMLEKMGWSSGKGLGAQENGIVEHVVAKYKNDEKGLGFEDRNDQWTKHEDDFNSLLANLSNAESDSLTLSSGVSLEKKSKKSKARIHYHKFTRGKDLSRYSEKDLANIFGKKSFKEPEVEECLKEDTLKTSEQVFTDKGNMDDYFKNKLATFKTKFLGINMNSKDNEESDYAFQRFSLTNGFENKQNESVDSPFSFYSLQNNDVTPDLELSDPDVVIQRRRIKKSKQTKKINNLVEDEVNNSSISTQERAQEILTNVPPNKEKKSKKKKQANCNLGIQSLDGVQELNNSSDNIQGTGLETEIGKSTRIKKCKKKKHKECTQETLFSDQVQEANSESHKEAFQHAVEGAPKKKSKKKKLKEYVEDDFQSCEVVSLLKNNNKNKNHVEDTPDQVSLNDNVPKKKKKRKNTDTL